jgi:hypothetical protein
MGVFNPIINLVQGRDESSPSRVYNYFEKPGDQVLPRF